jgi:hypothetical protein
MIDQNDPERDVLKRMLSTPPHPHKPPKKAAKRKTKSKKTKPA